jgi:hypothetical protein
VSEVAIHAARPVNITAFVLGPELSPKRRCRIAAPTRFVSGESERPNVEDTCARDTVR